jgi:hypothetical protein
MVWDNVETYGRPNRPQIITRRIRFACRIHKATDTHTLRIRNNFFFHGNNGYANAPQFYIIRTVLLRSTAPTRKKSGGASPKREHRMIQTQKSRPNKHKKHATNHSDRTLVSHYTAYDSRITLVTGWRNENKHSPPTHRNTLRCQSELRNVPTIHDRIPNNFTHDGCLLAFSLFTSLSNVECHVRLTGMSHTGRFSDK